MPQPPSGRDSRYDAVVVGAGFGGLGAALTLAERGARVLVLEAMTYPGGCASTFERGGVRYEAGATLFSGFGAGQLFRRWIDGHRLDVEFRALDPAIELRAPGLRLPVTSRRDEVVTALCAMPGAPRAAVRSFFDLQARVADTLWPLLDDPSLLPPFGDGAWRRHLAALPDYARLAPLAGRTLGSVMRSHGVAGFEPLRVLAESLCRITVQCGADESEAPLALAALDYPFRGAGHVTGGIGRFADALVGAIRGLGGEVAFGARAVSIRRDGTAWTVATRRGVVRAGCILANVLPHDLARLLGEASGAGSRIDRLGRDVASGWGAAMLYLVARAPHGVSSSASHVEIVQDPSAPFVEGNRLFCSISDAADGRGLPEGRRTITVSTHVAMNDFAAMPASGQASRIGLVQRRMREGIARFLPQWDEGIEREMTASPRTFERFTLRTGGFVGGVPRFAGWRTYRDLAPRAVRPGLWIVGDSVFPGQSALAAAVGGVKTAQTASRQLGRARREPDEPDAREEAPSAAALARGGGARRHAADVPRLRGVGLDPEGGDRAFAARAGAQPAHPRDGALAAHGADDLRR